MRTAAEKIVANIKELGPKRVGALVTDNAANCKLARELVVKEANFEHIVILRSVIAAPSLSAER